MKLSEYVRREGSRYRIARRGFRAGTIKDCQAPTDAHIVTEGAAAPPAPPEKVAIAAHAWSPELRDHLDRQAARLANYCAARGHRVAQAVKAIASAVNGSRPKLLALLTAASKAGCLDVDPLPISGDDDGDIPTLSMKRVKRGLYRAAVRRHRTADVNGAYNMMRVVLPTPLALGTARGERVQQFTLYGSPVRTKRVASWSSLFATAPLNV